jgi:hypothetical protein
LHGIERLSDLRIRDDAEKVAMVMTPIVELRRLLGQISELQFWSYFHRALSS